MGVIFALVPTPLILIVGNSVKVSPDFNTSTDKIVPLLSTLILNCGFAIIPIEFILSFFLNAPKYLKRLDSSFNTDSFLTKFKSPFWNNWGSCSLKSKLVKLVQVFVLCTLFF